MEEQESKQELLELDRHGVAVEELRFTDGRDSEGVHQVVLESLRSFVGHLHTILEDSNGELLSRVRSKPESEVTVDFSQVLTVFSQIFADFFEGA